MFVGSKTLLNTFYIDAMMQVDVRRWFPPHIKWLSNLVADKPIHNHTSESWMREDLTIVDMSPTFTNNI